MPRCVVQCMHTHPLGLGALEMGWDALGASRESPQDLKGPRSGCNALVASPAPFPDEANRISTSGRPQAQALRAVVGGKKKQQAGESRGPARNRLP